jgi:hypothetical protein
MDGVCVHTDGCDILSAVETPIVLTRELLPTTLMMSSATTVRVLTSYVSFECSGFRQLEDRPAHNRSASAEFFANLTIDKTHVCILTCL